MNGLYMLGGIASLAFGLYLTTIKIKGLTAGEQYGVGDYRLLLGGITFIAIGIMAILKYA